MTHETLTAIHAVGTVSEIVKLYKVTKLTLMNHIYRGKITARQSGVTWLVSLVEANAIYEVRHNGQD